jgi:hypothetical protein
MVTAGPNELGTLDPRDREYVESLGPEERGVVTSTILRYRREATLRVGDPVPAPSLHRLEDGRRVLVPDLVAGRPLVLVFGSFT